MKWRFRSPVYREPTPKDIEIKIEYCKITEEIYITSPKSVPDKSVAGIISLALDLMMQGILSGFDIQDQEDIEDLIFFRPDKDLLTSNLQVIQGGRDD